MTPTEAYAKSLLLSQLLRRPALAAAVDFLALPAGSHGLDAGCGVGVHLPMLREAVGPNGHVVGLDSSPSLLAYDLSTGTPRVAGTIQQLPFRDHAFDWLWSVDTVYPGAVVADPAPIIESFRRVVKPGGRIALLYWSAQKLLPGYPHLEAALDAAFVATVPYHTVRPKTHFLRASGWLRQSGLCEVVARTFVADVQGPFDEEHVAALAHCYQMFWGHLQDDVSSADWSEFQRLCLPDSADFIVRQPGYHAFLTYTLFAGTVTAKESDCSPSSMFSINDGVG